MTKPGLLFINADDWGRNRETSDRILDCVLHGTVTSASAMVFMADSERAAAVARESKIDAGLHLNFTTPFSGPQCPPALLERQRQVVAYLRRHALARVIFNPLLANSFEYVAKAQLDEFIRLFGATPGRLDGHHHMHLSANVLLGKLLPPGTMVRRNFSFQPGEKSWVNRIYRQSIDRRLARRHRLTDYFFALPPLQPRSRLKYIFSLAGDSAIELETHPVEREEYEFLMGDEILTLSSNLNLVRPSDIGRRPFSTAIDPRTPNVRVN
jgi:hypothetical protein